VSEPLTVVEVEPFPSKAVRVWGEEELLEFISYIAFHPAAGALIPGGGGLRKVRWSRPGKGKRGGVRVVYYFHDASLPLFLMTMYAKSQKANLTSRELKIMRKLVAELRLKYGKA